MFSTVSRFRSVAGALVPAFGSSIDPRGDVGGRLPEMPIPCSTHVTHIGWCCRWPFNIFQCRTALVPLHERRPALTTPYPEALYPLSTGACGRMGTSPVLTNESRDVLASRLHRAHSSGHWSTGSFRFCPNVPTGLGQRMAGWGSWMLVSFR